MTGNQKLFNSVKRSQLNEKRILLHENIPLMSPLVLYVEPSSYCNIKCKFCPQYLSPEKMQKSNMDLNNFELVLKGLSEFNSPLKLLRICGTGDPLMNKLTPLMLEKANAYNSNMKIYERLEMISNGILLNEKNMESIGNNLSRLIVSIEGLSDDEYLEWTGAKISLSKVIDNLLKFKSSKSNSCELHIKIHSGVIKNESRLRVFHEIFDDIADTIEVQALVDMWPDTNSSYVPDVNVHRYYKKIEKSPICAQIFKTMQINSDGSVIPCSIDWQAINKIGHINDNSLLEIWNGRAMRDFRLRHLRKLGRSTQPCKSCSFNELSDIDVIEQNIDTIIEKIEGYKL